MLPRRDELWMWAYLFVGLAQNGMAPILLPLASRGGAASGLSYAAFAVTGLAAPFLGHWADAGRRHRDLLVGGCALSALAFAALAAVGTGWAVIPLAAVAGLGVNAASTAGSVLAIDGVAHEQWDDRVADLQRTVSTGQVIGLLAAGVLAAAHPRFGFAFAAASLVGAVTLAHVSAPAGTTRRRRPVPAVHPMVGGEAGAAGPRQAAQHAALGELREFANAVTPALARFLVVWSVGYTAMNGIATLFPVVMTRHYGLTPIWPSVAYAAGICASLTLYRQVSRRTVRIGAGRVLTAGLAARLTLFVVLAVLGLSASNWAGFAVLIAFAAVQTVWPLLGVSANALAVELVPAARGEAVGLFNATTALASSLGSAAAGVILGLYGFAAVGLAASLCVATSLCLAHLWFGRVHGLQSAPLEAESSRSR